MRCFEILDTIICSITLHKMHVKEMGRVRFITLLEKGCHDQESNLGSGSNDCSPEVTNHYPEMTECGRNLNHGFIPRPTDKSVIISYQIYMNLLTNDSIINFNETKRKEEEKNKKEKKKTHILDFKFPRSFSLHTRCFHESPDVMPHSNIIHRSRVINARSSLNYRPSIQINVPNVDVRPNMTFPAQTLVHSTSPMYTIIHTDIPSVIDRLLHPSDPHMYYWPSSIYSCFSRRA